MGKLVSTPMANTTQSMTRCDNLQARCPARPVSDRACSISSGEITLLSPASRSTTVSGSGVGSKQLPCRVIVIASLKPGSYTHPRLQEAMTCAKTNGIGVRYGVPGTHGDSVAGVDTGWIERSEQRPAKHNDSILGKRRFADA